MMNDTRGQVEGEGERASERIRSAILTYRSSLGRDFELPLKIIEKNLFRISGPSPEIQLYRIKTNLNVDMLTGFLVHRQYIEYICFL